jgi:hypothetical protein
MQAGAGSSGSASCCTMASPLHGHEVSGRRRDGSISREGSVTLRRALIDLGVGLWHCEPAAQRYGRQLRARQVIARRSTTPAQR